MGKFRRIYPKKEKTTPGWGYWGGYGEIEVGISSSRIEDPEQFQADKLHYHRKGLIFIVVLEGSGTVEVNGEYIVVKKDEVLRVSPGEKYRHTKVLETPFSWITFCTSKDPEDKVVVG